MKCIGKASEHHLRITQKNWSHSKINFQRLQSSKHCKAYTDEKLESYSQKAGGLTVKRYHATRRESGWQHSGHWYAERMDIMWVRREGDRRPWALSWRIPIGGNGKVRRRENIPGRGNCLSKCIERASVSSFVEEVLDWSKEINLNPGLQFPSYLTSLVQHFSSIN